MPVACNAIWLKSTGGVQTWHSAPFMIAVAGLFKSQSLEGFSRGPNSLSQPSIPCPPESAGRP